jgi:DNA (cytosine-5)-methyltransferase 1
MKFGSLFPGIGGFDLGLERAGMSCQWQVEIEDYPIKILERHWPEVHRERDIKDCSGENLEPVDLICGGFPCQDISVAGAGAGLAGERSGLWYEMHRIIGDIKPRWVVVENVAALLSRGMDVVLRDLSTIGYDCEWHVIPASAVGAPHRRERVWIIARLRFGVSKEADAQRTNANGKRSYRKKKHVKGKAELRNEQDCESGPVGKDVPNAHIVNEAMRRDSQVDAAAMAGRDGNARGGQRDSRTGCTEITVQGSCDVPNAHGIRRNGGRDNRKKRHIQRDEKRNSPASLSDGEQSQLNSGEVCTVFPNAIGVCLRAYGKQWEAEPSVGRVAHGIPRRVDRLKGLGNAVVPQIVELIGRRIMEIEGNL